MQKMTVQFLQCSWSVLEKSMEALQFAQQQFYKVHFLLASKISLFISEGKKQNMGHWAKPKRLKFSNKHEYCVGS